MTKKQIDYDGDASKNRILPPNSQSVSYISNSTTNNQNSQICGILKIIKIKLIMLSKELKLMTVEQMLFLQEICKIDLKLDSEIDNQVCKIEDNKILEKATQYIQANKETITLQQIKNYLTKVQNQM